MKGTLEQARVPTVAGALDSLPSPDANQEDAALASAGCVHDDIWDKGVLDDVPSQRNAHTAVWTGSLMIVWGGGPTYENSGGRYDPVTDTWSETSRIGAPSARSYHTAVWTGTEMIVWGGLAGASIPGPGGRYDPLSDTWTPMSTIDEPSLREFHTAVWTGSLMLV